MTPRRVLAASLSLLLLAAGTLVVRPPAVWAAGDPECDVSPELCAVVTIAVSGNGTGDAFTGATEGGHDGNIECHREQGVSSGSCASYAYYVRSIGRSVSVTGEPRTGDHSRVCMDGSCSSGDFMGRTFSLARGGRYRVAFEFQLIKPVTVTITKEGDGSGVVTSSPSGISCGSDCSSDFPYLYSIHLTADPSGDSSFGGWNPDGPCADQDETCSFDTSGIYIPSHSITATFVDPLPPPPTAPPPTGTPTPTKTPTPTSTVKPTATPTGTVRPSSSAAATSSPGASSAGTAAPGPSTATPSGSIAPGASVPGVSPGGSPASSPTGSDPSGSTDPAASGDTSGTGGQPSGPPGATPPPVPSGSADQGGGGFVPLFLLLILVLVIGGGTTWLVRRGSKGA